jgi:hypothetical protein
MSPPVFGSKDDSEPAEKKKKRRERTVKAVTHMPADAAGQKTMLKTLNKVKWEVEEEIRAEDDNTITIGQFVGTLALLIGLAANKQFEDFMYDDPEFFFPFAFFYLYWIKRMSIKLRVWLNPDMEQRQWDMSIKKARKIDEYYENLAEDDLVKAFRKLGMGSGKWLEDEMGEPMMVMIPGDEPDDA